MRRRAPAARAASGSEAGAHARALDHRGHARVDRAAQHEQLSVDQVLGDLVDGVVDRAVPEVVGDDPLASAVVAAQAVVDHVAVEDDPVAVGLGAHRREIVELVAPQDHVGGVGHEQQPAPGRLADEDWRRQRRAAENRCDYAASKLTTKTRRHKDNENV